MLFLFLSETFIIVRQRQERLSYYDKMRTVHGGRL